MYIFCKFFHVAEFAQKYLKRLLSWLMFMLTISASDWLLLGNREASTFTSSLVAILHTWCMCNTGRWIKGVEGFTFYKAGWSNHRQVHLKHHSQGTDSQGGLNRFLCRLKSLLALWRNWKNVCLSNAVWCILNARILAPTQVFQCNQVLAQKPTLLPSLNSDNTPTHTAWL